MNRQQKRLKREKGIIASTLLLLDEKSFLDLRMSEVAQTAGCSMGAVYSHFSSKEDLLMACACSIIQSDMKMIDQVIAMSDKPLYQLLSGALSVRVINLKRPKNYVLRQLAINPCIWQRSSAARNTEINSCIARVDELLHSVGRRVLADAGIAHVSDEHTRELHMGLIGLSIGLYEMGQSAFGAFKYDERGSDGLELHLSNIERFLTGWNISEPFMLRTLHSLYEQTVAFVDDETFVP